MAHEHTKDQLKELRRKLSERKDEINYAFQSFIDQADLIHQITPTAVAMLQEEHVPAFLYLCQDPGEVGSLQQAFDLLDEYVDGGPIVEKLHFMTETGIDLALKHPEAVRLLVKTPKN